MAHDDISDIIVQLQAVAIKPNQRYRHYKTKGIYIVKEIVMLEATNQPAVAYFNPDSPELVWVRVYDDFIAKVDNQPRFSLLP